MTVDQPPYSIVDAVAKKAWLRAIWSCLFVTGLFLNLYSQVSKYYIVVDFLYFIIRIKCVTFKHSYKETQKPIDYKYIVLQLSSKGLLFLKMNIELKLRLKTYFFHMSSWQPFEMYFYWDMARIPLWRYLLYSRTLVLFRICGIANTHICTNTCTLTHTHTYG